MLRDQVQSLVGEPRSHKPRRHPPNNKNVLQTTQKSFNGDGKEDCCSEQSPPCPQPENILGPMVKEIKVAYRMRVTNQLILI